MADHTVTVESTLEALLVEKKYSTIRDILSTMNPADIASVFEGLDVVDAIAAAETNENDKPVEDITIESITFENYHAQ